MRKPPKKDNHPKKNLELSIVLVTYNNEKEVLACLNSLYTFNRNQFASGNWEIVLIDNASTDGTVALLTKHMSEFENLFFLKSKANLGFGQANNLAVKSAKGKYILLLNSDTIVEKESLSRPLEIIKSHPEYGAVGVKMLLGNGTLDYSCHRGFPTPWRAFCFFSGLTSLFPHHPWFAGYTLGFLDTNLSHPVDAINGAFLMISKDLGDELGWFDKDYFWNGEDLDFCYRIKQTGKEIFYSADTKIIHYKGSSGGHKRGSKTFYARFEVMKIFYRKHYKQLYPWWMEWLVVGGINLRMLIAYLYK
jgi:GT2 family glycosyltransferase